MERGVANEAIVVGREVETTPRSSYDTYHGVLFPVLYISALYVRIGSPNTEKRRLAPAPVSVSAARLVIHVSVPPPHTTTELLCPSGGFPVTPVTRPPPPRRQRRRARRASFVRRRVRGGARLPERSGREPHNAPGALSVAPTAPLPPHWQQMAAAFLSVHWPPPGNDGRPLTPAQ